MEDTGAEDVKVTECVAVYVVSSLWKEAFMTAVPAAEAVTLPLYGLVLLTLMGEEPPSLDQGMYWLGYQK